MNFKVLTHSSIVLDDNIYIDPFEIQNETHNAKVVFITHSHYDHFSLEDINKVKNENTWFVSTKEVIDEIIKNYNTNNIIIVEPNKTYEVCEISFSTFGAYNVNKKFHPKQNNWVGYNINLENKNYAILGDTDENEDNLKIKCDVLFVPVGGTFTMNAVEAANFTNKIKPKIAVPTHYGTVVGSLQDADIFKEKLNKEIECKVFF